MEKQLLFLGTPDDRQHLHRIKQATGSANVYVITKEISTVFEVEQYCKTRNITGIFCTQVSILGKLIGRENPSIDNYAGSYLRRGNLEWVFLFPLERYNQVNWVPFVQSRFITKLTRPEDWNALPSFDYLGSNTDSYNDFYNRVCSEFCIGLAVDIETFSNPLSIRCVGYTCITYVAERLRTVSLVIPCDSEFNLAWIRKLNSTPVAKIFQNGKYDLAYLAHYSAVPTNYLWDTATMFHAYLCELPKKLGFLGPYYIREGFFWKDLAESNDLSEYYRYCALDTWNTALIFLEWMRTAPEYAKNNYLMSFPLNYPCHLVEMQGLKQNQQIRMAMEAEVNAKVDQKRQELERMTVPGFNANSPPQVKSLLKVLGCGEVKSSDEKFLKQYSYQHPLNDRILGSILDVREERKLVGTYLVDKSYHGRVLYALDPHGTVTGRLASHEHHFWTGINVQNTPRDRKEFKATIEADEGFLFAECDLEQAESRDTGFIAGEERLIAAVTGERDFHSVNASAFFGIPYEEIYDQAKKKVKNKEIRNEIGKRVNHGANYNMGPQVLIDTMGLKNIFKARTLLKLPRTYSAKQVAEHLLSCFHKAYPGIRDPYYTGVISDVITKGLLIGATGWTRKCFGHPDKNKRDMNSYVAHPPQSLNAMVLNQAYMKVFYELAIQSEHRNNFKLGPQIHDSILFQFRAGQEHYCDMVRTRMEIPVTVRGYDGVVRTFTVPAAIKAGADGKGVRYWSMTE